MFTNLTEFFFGLLGEFCSSVVSLNFTWRLQVLVIDYKLTYPSGTATAILINGFHSKQGDKNAKYGFHHPHLSSLMFIFRLPLVQSSLDE